MTDEERGALFRHLVAWMEVAGITAPQRLALLQLVASDRLLRQAGRLIAPVEADELGRRLDRCSSSIRATLSCLQHTGLIARYAGEIDITAVAQAAGFRVAAPGPERAAENPAPCRKSGDSSNIEVESKKYNNINKLELLAEPSGFPADQLTAILDAIRRPEVRAGLPRADDIAALVDALPPGAPQSWEHSDIARAIMRIPALWRSGSGPGVSPVLIRASCARLGLLALPQALAALMGRAPKGLYIHLARSAGDPDVTAWQVLRAIEAAAASAPGQLTAAPEVATSTPRPHPSRPTRTKTRLQQCWDEAGGPPPLAGEFLRAAESLRRGGHAPPPLRKS